MLPWTAVIPQLASPNSQPVQSPLPSCVITPPHPADEAGRLEALRIHTRQMPLGADVDLPALAAGALRFTGAELAALCREAAMAALREDVRGAQEVAWRHFLAARMGVGAALSEAELATYEAWGKQYGR